MRFTHSVHVLTVTLKRYTSVVTKLSSPRGPRTYPFHRKTSCGYSLESQVYAECLGDTRDSSLTKRMTRCTS